MASFCRTLLFGNCTFEDFNEYFEFDLSEFMELFKALKKILQYFCETSENFKSFQFCKSYNCETYMVDSKPNIKLSKSNGHYSIEMNYVQFNELIFAISQTIIPTLGIKNSDSEFIDSLIDADIQALVQLQDYDKFISYFEHSKFGANASQNFRIFKTNFDLIYILHKLKKFCNVNLLPQNFQNVFVK